MATAYSVHFHTLFKTVAHPASASMSVLEMAISCFKVVPAFGLLLFLHQSSSHETLISVVGCLFPPQWNNAEYLQPLKGFEMLPFWSGHFCLPLWEWQMHGASLILFLTGLLFVPGTQALCC